MRISRIKTWQWVVIVFVVLMAVGWILPEQPQNDTTSTVSPAWLLLIPILIGTWALVQRALRNRRDRLDALEPSVEKFQNAIDELTATLDFFENHEAQFNENLPSGLVAQKDEHVIATVTEVGLVESRREPTTFRGGSKGVSIRITKKISVRQSGFRGRSTPGEEAPTVIDTGRFIISDKRAVFVGTKQSREFEWQKLLSYEMQALGRDSAIVFLPVSNRQKVSGIAADRTSIESIHKRIAFGVAVATGRKPEYLQMLREELRELRAEMTAFITQTRSHDS